MAKSADKIQRAYLTKYLKRQYNATTSNAVKEFIAKQLLWVARARHRYNKRKGGLGK